MYEAAYNLYSTEAKYFKVHLKRGIKITEKNYCFAAKISVISICKSNYIKYPCTFVSWTYFFLI